MGWWFGRIMTFEVIADAAAPAVASILADASAGAIASDASTTLVGYAAYGGSIAAAVQPLVDSFDLLLFDDGATLRPPLEPAPVVIEAEELGNSANGERASKIQRRQSPIRAIPSTLRLTYYDVARDYQTGEARATAGEPSSNEVQQQLPAVLSADDAKTLVHQMLARQWSERDRLTLRLPPARVGLEPGCVIQTELTPQSWIVDKCTIEGFVAIAELRPSWQRTASLAGEAGRIVSNSDVVAAPVTLGLIEAPNLTETDGDGPRLLIAASSSGPGWGTRPISLTYGGQTVATQTAAQKSVLGRASTLLANADAHLIDQANSVDIELADHEQWLTSCDDNALCEGTNLAVLGSELVQFGTVTPLGPGKFRLAHLLRGRAGTEWATGMHSAGETFCLLDTNSLRPVLLPTWVRGTVITATDRNGSAASMTFAALSSRPLIPDNLSADVTPNRDLVIAWTRRSRRGFAWIDEVDAPVGESREEYRVSVSGVGADLELTVQQPNVVIPASDWFSLGSGPTVISVRQVGDWAASPPAQLTVDLSLGAN